MQRHDIILGMRITLSLDDDLIPRVKTYAESRDLSVGKAVSELVWRGLHGRKKVSRTEKGVYRFFVSQAPGR